MLSALFYLRFTSIRNRIVRSIVRLRQPKYLAGAAVGAFYFYFLIFRRLGSPGGTGHGGAGSPAAAALASAGVEFTPALVLAIATAALMGLFLAQLALVLCFPAEKPGLKFSEAEIAFLFPAPYTRRRLIHFNLVSSQLTILLSSVLLAALSNRWSFLGGSGAVAHAIGWWVIFSSLSLNFTGWTLFAARWIGGRPDSGRRRAAALAVLAAAAGALVFLGLRRIDAVGYAAVFDAGPLRWLSLPFAIVAKPFLSADARSFLFAMLPALPLLAALYFRVSRQEVSFEEGSIALAEKRSHLRAARQSGRIGVFKPKARREPFRLSGSGRPETAFFWKNLLAIRSWFNLRAFASIISFAIIMATLSLRSSHGTHGSGGNLPLMVLVGSAIMAFYTLIAGPQFIRQDLRSDLANADMLKLYPLAGWQVVAGEMLAPIVILSGLLWIALLAAAWALSRLGDAGGGMSAAERLAAILCIAPVVPPLCALQLLVPNAAALLFPGWFQATRTRAGGIEAVGQRLIFAIGQLFAVLLALLPAAASAMLLIVATKWLIGLAAAVVLATLAVLVILGAELWIGLWWLGTRFEKLDIATELRAS
jgi:hypothetical protein